MRFLNKYTSYQKITSFLKYTPNRVLKFKRPKWKKIQFILKQKVNLKTAFINNSITKLSIKSWEKNKNYYKEGLLLKNSFYSFYNNVITTTYYKKLIKKANNLRFNSLFFKVFLKPLFFIDILLWKTKFCSSSYEVRQLLNSNKILVNNKVVKSNFVVKKGDLITFKPSFIVNKLSFEKSPTFELFSLFFEIDYYTNTIVILKDFTSFSDLDFESVMFDSVQLKMFIDYIKTK
jgi:ribosomal protein S4